MAAPNTPGPPALHGFQKGMMVGACGLPNNWKPWVQQESPSQRNRRRVLEKDSLHCLLTCASEQVCIWAHECWHTHKEIKKHTGAESFFLLNYIKDNLIISCVLKIFVTGLGGGDVCL